MHARPMTVILEEISLRLLDVDTRLATVEAAVAAQTADIAQLATDSEIHKQITALNFRHFFGADAELTDALGGTFPPP